MPRGRVYVWTPDPTRPLGGTAAVREVQLENLHDPDRGPLRLAGAHVTVRNGSALNLPGPNGEPRPTPIGDAPADENGDFMFAQGRGGGRVDKVEVADPDFRWRYIEAARFGEVNAYFHVDRIATRVNRLLRTLAAPPLPPVVVVVNAHHAATTLDPSGRRDGVAGRRLWLPFQGGHYRLSQRAIEVPELAPIAPTGEIHLGPGWRLLEHGALVEAAGGRYRASASHNPGIIYHEYGHHIARHTADLSLNANRAPDRQNNRKTALDEGMADYWAATMLDAPHIWAFHHRHDREWIHPRSLISPKTMADYDVSPGADVHANGTIWASLAWDIRTELSRGSSQGCDVADRLMLACLIRLRSIRQPGPPSRRLRTHSAPSEFATAAAALLDADVDTNHGCARTLLLAALDRRGIPVRL